MRDPVNLANSVLAAALALAAQGVAVFPCNPHNKKPITQHGFKDASTDPKLVRKWWSRTSNLIGVATGKGSGYFVVDLDRKPGQGDGVATWDAWQQANKDESSVTRVHETPSTGQHRLYKYPENEVIPNIGLGTLGVGIEIKGEGGYIIVPPSVMADGKKYVVLNTEEISPPPEFLLSKIRQYRDRYSDLDKRDKKGNYPPPDAELVAAALKAVSEILPNPDVNWDEWSRTCGVIAKVTGHSEAGRQAWDAWSQKSPKYNKQTTDEKWTTVSKSPYDRVGMGTLFWLLDQADSDWRKRYLKKAHDWKFESAPASSFKMKGIRWVWPNRFALGKIGLIVGLPDRAKSLILKYIMSRITKGGPWPCGEGHAPCGRVLFLTAEDDIEDTVIPRLIASKADMSRVEIIQMVRNKTERRMFNLATDLAVLRGMIEQFNDVVAIIIDPMSAYFGIGKVDSYRTTDVRGVLAPLKDLAEKEHVLVLGILHFNKKADITDIMLRVSDSLAFSAAARHCFGALEDAENKRFLFVRGKNNLASRDIKALSYTIDVLTVGKDDETRESIVAPYIRWGDDHVAITGAEAMELEAGGKKKRAHTRDKARILLSEMLANGPVPMTAIEVNANKQGISLRTLNRAKEDLGVHSNWDKEKGCWVWQLSQPDPTMPNEPDLPY